MEGVPGPVVGVEEEEEDDLLEDEGGERGGDRRQRRGRDPNQLHLKMEQIPTPQWPD